MNQTPRILIDAIFRDELARELTIAHELRAYETPDATLLSGLMADTDILVSGEFKASWRDPAGSYPRLVHTVGAGIDGIDQSALPPGCRVCNVYGHQRGVAEQVFAMMMALQHRMFALDAALRKGDWSSQWTYISEVSGKTLLILGLGHIGMELARWGRFLDMHVTALTRTPTPDRGADLGLQATGGLDELAQHLPHADFVVVALPATAETTGFIGAHELALMKPNAFIINVGRGPVIDEASLYHALQARLIAGAGIDVWYQYPETADEIILPGTYPFQDLDNIIMLPHKPTSETMAYRWKKIADNIARFARGEELDNLVYTAPLS